MRLLVKLGIFLLVKYKLSAITFAHVKAARKNVDEIEAWLVWHACNLANAIMQWHGDLMEVLSPSYSSSSSPFIPIDRLDTFFSFHSHICGTSNGYFFTFNSLLLHCPPVHPPLCAFDLWQSSSQTVFSRFVTFPFNVNR